MSKYQNKKTEIDGIKFDSKKEASRYCELRFLVKAGAIKDLELQPKFVLLEPFENNGKKYRGVNYFADFRYIDIERGGIEVVEDVKSVFTAKNPVYRIKKKWLLSKYNTFEFIET